METGQTQLNTNLLSCNGKMYSINLDVGVLCVALIKNIHDENIFAMAVESDSNMVYYLGNNHNRYPQLLPIWARY